MTKQSFSRLNVRIYIEGGGDGPKGKQALRKGFNDLLATQRDAARRRQFGWDVVLCGGRNATLDAFEHAAKDQCDDLVALLVDAEGPVADGLPSGRVAHLGRRDKWNLSHQLAERIHLMTQSMETWIAADLDMLQSYYGKGFQPNALPRRAKLDEEDRHSLSRALETATRATQKGSYHKIRHASELLSKIRPEQVGARCESFRLFTDWLDGVLKN
jgi:Domain of unknown function (DUF4276)